MRSGFLFRCQDLVFASANVTVIARTLINKRLCEFGTGLGFDWLRLFHNKYTFNSQCGIVQDLFGLGLFGSRIFAAYFRSSLDIFSSNFNSSFTRFKL